MSYEPDLRYLKDLGRKKEADTPFSEQARSYRDQLWNIDGDIRIRWAGTGAFWGLMLSTCDPFGWRYHFVVGGHTISLLAYFAVCILGGLAIGFIAASLWRRFTAEA